jgi:hypothetical protein
MITEDDEFERIEREIKWRKKKLTTILWWSTHCV